MKKFITFLILFFPLFALTQTTHTVAAKESLFSIGRLYNVHPRELAAFNNIPFETGLTIGQVLKIPAKGSMALPSATTPPKTEPVKPSAIATTPMYHTVAKKEGLYSISKKYNASIQDIKKWNNLSSDALNEGMNLIVGYTGGNAPQTAANPSVAERRTEPETPVVVREPARPARQDAAANRAAANFSGGFFKASYQKQMVNKHITEDRGMAGVFKSTSGWEDGKYYCLHNSAPAGSFIKVTNPATQRSVYAKVLDLIPDLKQNSGLIIRISNAAASELGAGAANFDCQLQF